MFDLPGLQRVVLDLTPSGVRRSEDEWRVYLQIRSDVKIFFCDAERDWTIYDVADLKYKYRLLRTQSTVRTLEPSPLSRVYRLR